MKPGAFQLEQERLRGIPFTAINLCRDMQRVRARLCSVAPRSGTRDSEHQLEPGRLKSPFLADRMMENWH